VVCPTDETLRSLLLDADRTSLAETLTHLTNCAACRARLSQWDDEARLDSLLNAANNSDVVFASLPDSEDAPTNTYAVPRRRVGQYELLRSVGKGGGGEVFEARHVLLRRRVAVKLLDSRHSGDQLARQRFFREMESIGKLDHPHVVHAHDAGEADGTLYLAMEYVEGENVEAMARRRRVIPIAEACEIVRQAALGLQHIWESGLVHRDLKPSNLLMSKTGVKIADLGLALLHDRDSVDDRLTGERTVLGTADYMSPEQAEGSHEVDIRADVYSLGCTLFRLLAGRAPYAVAENISPLRKMWAHASEPTPDVRTLRPDTPEELARLIQKLMSKNREDRPVEPRQLAEDLLPYCGMLDPSQVVPGVANASGVRSSTARELNGTSGSATHRTVIEQTHEVLQKHQTPVVAIVAVLLTLAGLWLPHWIFPPGDPPQQPVPGMNTAGAAPAPGPVLLPEVKNPVVPVEPLVARILPNEVETLWMNVFQQPPQDLNWNGRIGAGTWRLDADLQALTVMAPQALRLIQLGEITDDTLGPLELSTDAVIHSRVGCYGFFFGFRELPADSAVSAEFQGIEINTLGATDEVRTLLVRRHRTRVARMTGALISENNHHVKISLPTVPESISLTALLNGDVVEQVRLNDTECSALCSPRLNNQFARDDYLGPFGVYVYHASVEVRKPVFQRAKP